MRLLLTCHRDPFSHVGGSEEVIKQLALGLARRGHEVVVVTRREDGRSPDVVYVADDVVSVLAFESNGRGPFTTNRELADFMGSGFDAVVLYGQNVWVTDEVWRRVGKGTTRRWVYFPVGFPGLWGDYPGFLNRLVQIVYHWVVQRHILEHSHVVAALTDRELATVEYISRPQELVKIPNGVDWAHFQGEYDDAVLDQYGIERPFVLNLGGDYRNKRLADACLGVRELNKRLSRKVQLVLAGPGTEPYSNSWVRGLGTVPEADKVALYREAECVLQTSDFEGFGLTLLEALAAGVPFVSTRAGAAEELALQFGGTLIHMQTPASIGYHLAHELETERDPDELRAVAARYDWPIIAELLERACLGRRT